MKKVYLKIVAVLVIAVIVLANFIWISNKKVNAEEFHDITYANYSGWNNSENVIENNDNKHYFRWGDINCDGVLNDVDLYHLAYAMREGFLSNDLVYDLADVAEPYGRITKEDYDELDSVVSGKKERKDLPICSICGDYNATLDSVKYLDGNDTMSSNDICVATAIITGGIKCIGAPRIFAMSGGSSSGYDTLTIFNKIWDLSSKDGIETELKKISENNYIAKSRTFYPREPANKWFEYEVTPAFYSQKVKYLY